MKRSHSIRVFSASREITELVSAKRCPLRYSSPHLLVYRRPQFGTPTHGRARPGDSEPVLNRHILNAVRKLLPRCDGDH
ncbi:hypothetical protein NDU88_002649 [Pleurodeles waltl]|uniref:Uncharacterized protein n=1 Tax=Pleurodeles waltl TaxID=8319 RepID=A0AAV7M180_PLEWA|nr:hypothetical protein NDU88_002649 [Pleurodeles waltl]